MSARPTLADLSDSLIARAGARWDEVVGERPDLAPAIEVQRILVTRVIDIDRQLREHGLPALATPAPDIAAKLARGVPALRGETIRLPSDVLAPFLEELCDHLARGGAGAAACRVRETLGAGRIDAGSLLAASFARDECAIRSSAISLGISPDLLWLVAELALGPVAHAMQRALFSNEPGENAVAAWDRGCCPACGSWPALAELREGTRYLRCSFCAAAWRLQSYRCVYCGEGGEPFTTAAPDLERPRRLELCASCGGYLKAIEVAEPTPFPLLAIEDLATLDLDTAAIERGYGRPPLVKIDESPRV